LVHNKSSHLIISFFFFLVGQGLKKQALCELEPHLQSILLWLFWRWSLTKYLSRLASKSEPLDLCLPRKQTTGVNHRHLACFLILFLFVYLGSTGGSKQGLALVRQEQGTTISAMPQSFLLYFSNRVSHFCP
jgi:hypothetical protein